jgi:hypothetical protein
MARNVLIIKRLLHSKSHFRWVCESLSPKTKAVAMETELQRQIWKNVKATELLSQVAMLPADAPSIEQLQLLICKLASNVFAIGEYECPGTMFLPLATKLNHGCMPNVYVHYDPKNLKAPVSVIALRDLKKHEELEYYYGRSELESFACKCSTCAVVKK